MNVRLSSELDGWLRDESAKTDKSMNSIVNEALRIYMESRRNEGAISISAWMWEHRKGNGRWE